MKIIIATACLMLGLSACAVAPEDRQALADVSEFTLADLRAAEASATAHGDTIAATCWAALIDAKAAIGDTAATDIKGAFSGIQAVRNARRRVQSGLSDEVKIGCGPLALDAVASYSRLARLLKSGL